MVGNSTLPPEGKRLWSPELQNKVKATPFRPGSIFSVDGTVDIAESIGPDVILKVQVLQFQADSHLVFKNPIIGFGPSFRSIVVACREMVLNFPFDLPAPVRTPAITFEQSWRRRPKLVKAPQASSGRDGRGENGHNGAPGFPGSKGSGRSRPDVLVVCERVSLPPGFDQTSHFLTMDFAGLPGVQGQDGQDGQDGGDGGYGREGVVKLEPITLTPYCDRGPQRGGHGGHGGKGGDAGDGGDGGAGARIFVVGPQSTLQHARHIAYRFTGSIGADPGQPGKGGQGGSGGRPGDYIQPCQPERHGLARGKAEDGRKGRRGNKGADGSVDFVERSVGDFL
jgi:hypothetical protein